MGGYKEVDVDPEVRETILSVIEEERKKQKYTIIQSQRIVLGIMAAIILIMLLFPPFYTHLGSKSSAIGNVGYGFILDPPKPEQLEIYYNINYMLLITQWSGVLLVGGLIFLLLRCKNNDKYK